jgi:hypothetical protein
MSSQDDFQVRIGLLDNLYISLQKGAQSGHAIGKVQSVEVKFSYSTHSG